MDLEVKNSYELYAIFDVTRKKLVYVALDLDELINELKEKMNGIVYKDRWTEKDREIVDGFTLEDIDFNWLDENGFAFEFLEINYNVTDAEIHYMLQDMLRQLIKKYDLDYGILRIEGDSNGVNRVYKEIIIDMVKKGVEIGTYVEPYVPELVKAVKENMDK